MQSGLTYRGSKRFARTKNRYLPYYDPNQEENCLMYGDANAVYAHATSHMLPCKNIKIEKGIDLQNMLKTSDSSSNVVEIYFEIPQVLHDKFQ